MAYFRRFSFSVLPIANIFDNFMAYRRGSSAPKYGIFLRFLLGQSMAYFSVFRDVYLRVVVLCVLFGLPICGILWAFNFLTCPDALSNGPSF